MNIHPEAVKARHDAQQQMLAVIESMMDGDTDDAHHHLVLWKDRYRYAIAFEQSYETTNAVSPEAEEAGNLRLLLAELYDFYAFADPQPSLLLKRRIQAALGLR